MAGRRLVVPWVWQPRVFHGVSGSPLTSQLAGFMRGLQVWDTKVSRTGAGHTKRPFVKVYYMEFPSKIVITNIDQY